MQIISTQGMTYHAKTRSMVAEDSCLDEELNHRIGLRSHLTGMVIKMRFEKCHKNAEGELTHWTFVTLEPHAKVDRLVVFND